MFPLPAIVATLPLGAIARMRLLSTTIRLPALSKAIPLRSLNEADVPTSSAYPRCLPAMVLEAPAGVMAWITPQTAIYTSPFVGWTARAFGSEKAAAPPIPSMAGFV
jgi:hypothetical protein